MKGHFTRGIEKFEGPEFLNALKDLSRLIILRTTPGHVDVTPFRDLTVCVAYRIQVVRPKAVVVYVLAVWIAQVC